MERYFFHTEDGQCFPDEAGVELPDLLAARRMALKTMCEMAGALSDDLWAQGSLRVTATDARGRMLFRLDLSATTSAEVLQSLDTEASCGGRQARS